MKKLRMGVLGMGQRTCHHGGTMFGECKEEVQLAAVCDNRPDRLAYGKGMYEQTFGYEIAAYDDYLEMYDKAGLDGVFVAGPNHLHRDMTLPALERGIHVLCEKPMEVSLARCDEMIAAARKANRILAIGLQMHYRIRYHKIKELIEKGAIGKVAQLWCTEYRGTFGKIKDWVWDPAKSGGAIVEKNCHHYDLLNWWADSRPTTVYASGNIMLHSHPYGFKSEIVDNAWVINDYENGARGMVGICFLADEKMTHRREFGILGTKGRIFFNLEDGEIVHVSYASGHQEHLDYRDPQWVRGGLMQDFVHCIRAGESPLVSAEKGKESLLVPMAAEISIREKRVVHVAEVK